MDRFEYHILLDNRIITMQLLVKVESHQSKSISLYNLYFSLYFNTKKLSFTINAMVSLSMAIDNSSSQKYY